MSRLAIVEPKTLLGEAVREALGTASQVWSEVELFTTDTEGVGAVTDVAGRAALVQSFEEGLSAFDVVVFCGSEVDPHWLRSLPDACRTVFIDPQTPVEGAVPIVAGLNDEAAQGVSRISSPSPAVLMLAHVLAPLRQLASIDLVAHVLQPASSRGKEGLDELFDQTRALLTMSDKPPSEIFGTQLAFNLLPWQGAVESLATDLATILDLELDARIHLSQAGVFHGSSASLSLRFANDPGVERLRDLLRDSPVLQFSDEPELLGPVAVAAADKVVIGEITVSPIKGYGLWCCMDNLVLEAANALAIARP